MKNLKLTLGTVLLATIFVACDDSKEKEAQKLITDYTAYVDSVSNLNTEQAATEWEAIAAEHENKQTKAQSALIGVEDKTSAESEIDKANIAFETYKIEVERARVEKEKQNLRNALFGENKVGNDMSFAWVNKDNILSVYENFVTTVDEHKDHYSREDWDEIKLLYEALDTRKNTVEKEGLTTSDNLKIAELKMKFAPMYTTNRVGAKTEENSEAKE